MTFRACYRALLLCALLTGTTGAAGQSCYESSIVTPTPFLGNHGEIFKLADGSFWQVQYEYEYLYEYYPNVIICPSSGKLSVNGKTLNVSQVSGGTQARRAPPRSMMAESAKVEAAHPGWTKIMATNDFKAWLAKQPGSLRKLEQSDRGDDAILLLDLYKRGRERGR